MSIPHSTTNSSRPHTGTVPALAVQIAAGDDQARDEEHEAAGDRLTVLVATVESDRGLGFRLPGRKNTIVRHWNFITHSSAFVGFFDGVTADLKVVVTLAPRRQKTIRNVSRTRSMPSTSSEAPVLDLRSRS